MSVSVLSTPDSVGVFDPADPYGGLSHTCPAGSGTQRLLLLHIGVGDEENRTLQAAPSYGGQTMTQIGTDADEGVFCGTTWYYLNEAGIDAASSATFSINPITAGANTQLAAMAVCLDGVDQATPIDTGGIQSATGATGTTVGVTVSSASGNLCVAGIMSDDETGITANQTQLYQTGAINGDTVGAAQYAAGAASVTLQWTQDSNRYAIVGFEVNAASGGGGTAALEWKQPTSQPTTHFIPTIVMNRVKQAVGRQRFIGRRRFIRRGWLWQPVWTR